MIEVYGKTNCGFCVQAKQLLDTKNLEYRMYTIDENITRDEFINKFPDVRTVPLIYKDGERIGGYMDLKALLEQEQME